MTVPSIPRLRPNTYLTLLIRATNKEFGKAPSLGQSTIKLKRSTLLADLMKLLDTTTPTNQDTLSSYMSQFLNGSRPYSGTYFPFNTVAFQSKAQLRMEDDYKNVQCAMDKLCHTYLNMTSQNDMNFLVGGLIEAITQDDSIDETFCIGDHRIEKSKLCDVTDVFLQPFLLDVWYQVATQYHNSKEAEATYKEWTGEGSPRPITTCIGATMAKKITVYTTAITNEIKPTSISINTGKNLNNISNSHITQTALTIDPLFEEYISNQFTYYKNRNIAVCTPQLLLMSLKYGQNNYKEPKEKNRALEILNCFEHREKHIKQYGNLLLELLSQIDNHYKKTGRTYSDEHYMEYQNLVQTGIENSPDLLKNKDCISPVLFCYFIFEYSKGQTIAMIKNHLGDQFDSALECIKYDKLPSFPPTLEFLYQS